ncbi:DNA methyltransferase [Sulfurovum riftiae]|uniref:site-specific DNA-methyltransferase (adenine-specific) n=2 Tax=Sulfurovum riftiae TaxID=1630136 RepID=A0A151CGF8_9BACT|nr:DNA methyltransferase [Sulfurovum riftiae]
MGISTEHSYRGDLQNLLSELCVDVTVTNEPKRQACGAPDYIITKKGIPIGYIEAKDVGKDLDDKSLKEQFDRYKASLDNLAITDYLTFRFYRDAEETTSVAIGKIVDGRVVPQPHNFKLFAELMQSFCLYVGQTITSASKLSKMMATKARLLANVIEKALKSDEENYANSTLKEQMEAFRQILIHDIDAKEFADIYAQTIAYGMFAARLHDTTLDDFSRQEAAELIPKSNPFLRSLFGYIAGPDIDDRIEWIVADLADIFRATDVKALLKDFGKATAQTDPMLHFYETFLGHYDKKLKKARGVWYTPEPVVGFIVRAVDHLLKEKFHLPEGLADTSKTTIQLKSSQGGDKRYKDGYKRIEKEVHKVQILDPATGTGTFLADVVKHIYKKFEGQQGIWNSYVHDHLIPRLNGFEILMASYAMAHLKIDLLLAETGYKPKDYQRLKIFLTNSLEEHHPDTGTLFASWLAIEADEANKVKRDTPVMVVLGNPPYSVSSSNKGKWINDLMEDYKKDLNERNIQPLSDDYIKFIRYGEHYIERNGEGILAYISNNSFIDGIIHRQMRKHLLETFDEIYILDLHGNSNKKETSPDGSKDENVFDIQQGVSINIFIRTKGSGKGLAKVFHHSLYGVREIKYNFLNFNNITSIPWEELAYREPYNFFIPKDYEIEEVYNKGFSIDNLYQLSGRGISFRKDNLLVKPHYNIQSVETMITDICDLNPSKLMQKYSFKETKDWKIDDKRIYFTNAEKSDIHTVLYRPFDFRFTYYPLKHINKIIVRGDDKKTLMAHFLKGNNLGLICPRQSIEGLGVLLTKNLTENKIVSAYNPNYIFPLYLYPDKSSLTQERTPNLDPSIVKKIADGLGLTFTPEKTDEPNTFAPIDLLDYIYAVLHSPSYREKYKEFLKIDFPRVPYPDDTETFWKLVTLGSRLRTIHLMESPELTPLITQYPVAGDNTVTRKIVKKDWQITNEEAGLGRVWINDEQYFDNVPVKAWEFYIGGYQPAQKWLKDRHGRTLSYEDILHYQKIVKALMLTGEIMQEIDRVRGDERSD